MNHPNPYAAPAGYGGHPPAARLEGEVLVVPKEAYLPDVCMKCGTHEGIVRRQAKFQWTPVWARVSIIFCTIGGLIAMLLTTKKGSLSLPLCGPCNARWGQAVAALIVSIIALVVGIFTFRVFDEPAIGGIIFLVTLVAFIGIMLGFVKPRMLQVEKIDDSHLYLKGFHPGAGRAVTGG